MTLGDRGFTVFIAVPSYPNPLEVSGCQGRRNAGRLVGVSRGGKSWHPDFLASVWAGPAELGQGRVPGEGLRVQESA